MRPKNIQNYGFAYNAGKFWAKLKKGGKKAGAKGTYLALVLYYALGNPNISRRDRNLILGALGYFILPIDLFPDFLPGGFSDDIAALVFAAVKVAGGITPEIKERAKLKVYEIFGETGDESLDYTPSVDWEGIPDDYADENGLENEDDAVEGDE